MRNLSPPLQHTAASIRGEMQKQSVRCASSIVQCALGAKVDTKVWKSAVGAKVGTQVWEN